MGLPMGGINMKSKDLPIGLVFIILTLSFSALWMLGKALHVSNYDNMMFTSLFTISLAYFNNLHGSILARVKSLCRA